MAKILIVDDDAAFRFLVRDFLEMNGYECMEAGSVAQACRQLWWNGADLILSDLNMPTESGLALLSHVNSSYPLIPFVMVTGSSDIEVCEKALREGASAYLTKPCRLSELLAVVTTTIRDSSAFQLSMMLWAES